MGSKQTKSDVNSEILPDQITILSSPTPPQALKEKVVLLGISNVGKSTLFHGIKRIISKLGHSDTTQEEFEKELQLVCSNVIDLIWDLMGETEKCQFKESLSLEIKTLFDTFDQGSISEKLLAQFDCSELLLNLWKIPHFRGCYESAWRSDTSIYVYENVKELIFGIESKTKFHPLSLCHPRTRGIHTFGTTINNTELNFVDVGGRGNERRHWIHCFDHVQTLIFCVSLADFNQMRDDSTMRMNESIDICGQALGSRWFVDARKILLFTKPDILLKKLNHGIKYERELNVNIRPELEGIVGENEKVIVNSIVSEYMKNIEHVKIDSYHIINTILDEDVKCVIDMVFDEKLSQKTTFISHCLLEKNNEMQFKLFNNCLNGNLTDIQISFNKE